MRNCIALILILSVATLGCVLGGCGDTHEPVRIMSWNVQNLFDGTSDGNEYPEYDPSHSDWGLADYHSRLETLSLIMESADADIILLQEVEGETVMKDLGRRLSLHYHAVSRDPGSAIQTGVLSRYPLREVSVHAPPGDRCRSLLKVVLSIDGERLVLFNNHWRSRRGGPMETVRSRCDASRLLFLLVREVMRKDPGSLIIIGGDLNTSVTDGLGEDPPVMLYHDGLDPDRLCVSGEKSVVGGPVFFDPWQQGNEESGSYWYDGSWYEFDHLLAGEGAFDGKGLEYSFGGVYMTDALTEGSAGHPYRYSRYRKRGVSDHFPVIMELCR